MTQQPFYSENWELPEGTFDFQDITYHVSLDGKTARVAIDRPECRNAFRPQTVDELLIALEEL